MIDDLIDRLAILGQRLDAFGGRLNGPYAHPWGVEGFHTCGDAIRKILAQNERIAELEVEIAKLEAERAPAP